MNKPIHSKDESKISQTILGADFLLNTILLNTSDYSIIFKDISRKIVIWNAGATKNYGYTAEEMIGKDATILHIEEDIQSGKVNQFFDAVIKMGKSEEIFERQRKNGEQFTAIVTMSLSCVEGRPIGFVVISKDITEQRRLELQLRNKNIELEQSNIRIQQATRLKSEFLANMSHELRTPLNAIIGFTELMFTGKVGDMALDHREYLGDILSSSHHLLQLINDVLDLSKIESGKMEFYPETVNLNKIVMDIKQILLTLIAKKRIKFTSSVDATLTDIFIDAAKFKQVLYNFISNAIKFTYDEGEVSVCITKHGSDDFCLEVHDTGIGIRQDDLKKLFVEFQQLDSSLAKNYQGTGLGLALTRRIIEAQGGRVGVKSKIHVGSTFYAILPKIYRGSYLLTTAALPTHVDIPAILMIEDDANERVFIKNFLMKEGYSVDIAINGREALRLSRLRRYDAIILDLLLPDMNGWDILNTFRAEELNKNVPVFIVTVVAEKSISAGHMIHDFLIKPIEPSVLLAALARSGILPYSPPSDVIFDDAAR